MTSPDSIQSLKSKLSDWEDFDAAAYALACCLGLLPEGGGFGGEKWMFWSDNPVGNALYKCLQHLVEVGVLEHDEEEQKFRWAPTFKLT